jgi:hypothetical protein
MGVGADPLRRTACLQYDGRLEDARATAVSSRVRHDPHVLCSADAHPMHPGP